MPSELKIAIACQGGGSHAAFGAGVLLGLMERPEPLNIVALSGTSGGAMSAALAWAGLIDRGVEDASGRVARFWRDLEAHDLFDAIANFWSVMFARLPVTPEVSPYVYASTAEPALRRLLKVHLALDRIPMRARAAHPKLFVGATDVLSGERVVFTGEHLTETDLIASAAVPPLFKAVHADKRVYWDGLFATNPPVREFTDLPVSERPDEIWVVQINPQRRGTEPRTMQDITDRRNELSGNVALAQELAFIDKINELVAKHGPIGDYKRITLRVVEIGVPRLDYPSKLDRSSGLIQRLLKNGRERSAWFFEDKSLWPRPGALTAECVTPQREGVRSLRSVS